MTAKKSSKFKIEEFESENENEKVVSKPDKKGKIDSLRVEASSSESEGQPHTAFLYRQPDGCSS
jgi:hypothetical protein